MKNGFRTSEFTATAAGMFIVTLLALLAAFRVISISDEQRTAILNFAAVASIVLPSVYAVARSWVKAKAESPSSKNESAKVEINQ